MMIFLSLSCIHSLSWSHQHNVVTKKAVAGSMYRILIRHRSSKNQFWAKDLWWWAASENNSSSITINTSISVLVTQLGRPRSGRRKRFQIWTYHEKAFFVHFQNWCLNFFSVVIWPSKSTLSGQKQACSMEKSTK